MLVLVACPVPAQPARSSVRLLVTDDLLVATQGGDQRDVRAVVGTPRATPSRCRRPITARLRGQACRFSWRPWKSGSLGTPGRLDMGSVTLLSVNCRGEVTGAALGHTQSRDKARGPMSGELAGRQGDGINNSPPRPTLPDGSEAGPR